MRNIKFLVMALMMALAVFIYAAGQGQESKKSCGTDKANCCASCCAKEGSCCKAHKMGNQTQAGAQTATQEKQKACDGCECCKDGKSCCGDGCKMEKTGKMDQMSACCEMSKEGCCSAGGCACCTKDKAKAN